MAENSSGGQADGHHGQSEQPTGNVNMTTAMETLDGKLKKFKVRSMY